MSKVAGALASLVAFLALTQAPLASAAGQGCVPSRALSTVPQFIRVVGTHAGEPDPAGLFVITARDFTNAPIANAPVMLDFINCGDIRLCTEQVGGLWVDCPTRTIHGLHTDETGVARFTVLGAARAPQPGTEGGMVSIFVDGYRLAVVTAVVPDENGALTTHGVEATDLSALILDLGSQTYRARSDFNEDGVLGGADLARWLTWYGQGRSRDGCPARALCP